MERRIFHPDRDVRVHNRFDLRVPRVPIVAADPLGGKIVIRDCRTHPYEERSRRKP
jgi:hypothetical protein